VPAADALDEGKEAARASIESQPRSVAILYVGGMNDDVQEKAECVDEDECGGPVGIAELRPPGLRGGKRKLRALADHLALGLRYDSHNADHKFVRFRHVRGNEGSAGILQAKKETGVAAEPVEFWL